MSTIIFCDGSDGECRKTDEEVKLYTPNNVTVAKALVVKGWIYTVYDSHICEDCINDYYNEEDEQLLIYNGYIVLGKDFKAKENS